MDQKFCQLPSISTLHTGQGFRDHYSGRGNNSIRGNKKSAAYMQPLLSPMRVLSELDQTPLELLLIQNGFVELATLVKKNRSEELDCFSFLYEAVGEIGIV